MDCIAEIAFAGMQLASLSSGDAQLTVLKPW
jgi:hypothetical protein